ncbi:transposon Tf2-12 polyprotein [Trichonephila inaurata madagascariensis]|uniref:RNA-directed DNA polymerase n=1 Tax=Trichonephila inaurata madagascariensis TaxID=2747483 RepID=A0A8X7BZW5_9ARAC|nr:transposon Tf2-12 polyprotein [Trichonephila inaurata madagascariensis]
MRFLHSVLRGLNFCFSYIDDILVASKDEAQHISHLKQVFQRLQGAGLVIKVAKCQFLQNEVDFLGHHISVNGIEPSKERIKVIEDFRLPETVKDLRRYLGVINFYHRFIPNAAENQAVLNNYLKGKKSNDKNKIHWTGESVQAFENSKQQLSKATVLVHPSENAHISLMVDASDNGNGAVLQAWSLEFQRESWSFFSRKLTDAQKRYSTTETTSAELLYGESISLPCDFFEDTLFQPQSEFVQTLKATINDSKPVPFSYHSKQKPFIFKDLKDYSHVFIRTDSVHRSLQPPYHGPYKVINRSGKVFTLFIKGKNVNVSIDRLKPCFSGNSSESDIESSIGEDTPNKPAKMLKKKIRFAPLPLLASTRATRSGRQVRLPVRYQ